MSSLIIDLQKDIFENKDILSILNKAYSISKELELHDFSNWINSEINGYSNVKNIPDYRFIDYEFLYDTYDYRGFTLTNKTVIKNVLSNIPKECRKEFLKHPVKMPLPEITHICEKKPDTVTFSVNGACGEEIKKNIPNATKIYKKSQLYQFESIIDYVKHELIEWTSELKKNNILGESYVFTQEDVANAKIINNIILSNSSIQVGDNIQFNDYSYKNEIKLNLDSVKKILVENEIDKEAHDEINEKLIIIEDEIEKENPNLGMMNDICIYLLGFISQVLSGVVSGLLLNHFSSIINILSNVQLLM